MQSPYQVLLFLFFHFSLPASSLLFPEARLICSPSNSPHDPTFISDFVTVMDSLAHRITTAGWATHASGSVYGLGQCLSDLSQSDCALCFAQARTKLPSCLPSNAGRIFLDGCFLRYDNYSFFAEPIDPQHDYGSCGSNSINGKAERSLFAMNVKYLLKNMTDTAVRNHGFAAGLRGDVHGWAQCWKSVEKEGCRECLEKAGREVMGCLPSDEGRGLNAGCYLRYSIKSVYSQAQNMEERQQKENQEGICCITVTTAV